MLVNRLVDSRLVERCSIDLIKRLVLGQVYMQYMESCTHKVHHGNKRRNLMRNKIL